MQPCMMLQIHTKSGALIHTLHCTHIHFSYAPTNTQPLEHKKHRKHTCAAAAAVAARERGCPIHAGDPPSMASVVGAHATREASACTDTRATAHVRTVVCELRVAAHVNTRMCAHAAHHACVCVRHDQPGRSGQAQKHMHAGWVARMSLPAARCTHYLLYPRPRTCCSSWSLGEASRTSRLEPPRCLALPMPAPPACTPAPPARGEQGCMGGLAAGRTARRQSEASSSSSVDRSSPWPGGQHACTCGIVCVCVCAHLSAHACVRVCACMHVHVCANSCAQQPGLRIQRPSMRAGAARVHVRSRVLTCARAGELGHARPHTTRRILLELARRTARAGACSPMRRCTPPHDWYTCSMESTQLRCVASKWLARPTCWHSRYTCAAADAARVRVGARARAEGGAGDVPPAQRHCQHGCARPAHCTEGCARPPFCDTQLARAQCQHAAGGPAPKDARVATCSCPSHPSNARQEKGMCAHGAWHSHCMGDKMQAAQ